MKQLSVPFIHVGDIKAMGEISAKMDHIHQELIHLVPWAGFPYKPQVAFAIAHGEKALFLKFYVEEKHLKAIYSEPNNPVYKDSCVEMFISFGDELEYYNFEFNCAGTCLLSFGEQRAMRQMSSDEIIRSISFQNTIKPASNTDANIAWELTLAIPYSVFQYHEISSLRGKNAGLIFISAGMIFLNLIMWFGTGSKRNSPTFIVPNFSDQ